jgi:hypothetical protein
MSPHDPIEQELDKGTKGLMEGNYGLARVCARRAVAIGVKAESEKRGTSGSPGDAMHQLRRIQSEEGFPLEVREAAQRLLTPITQSDRAPVSTNPIADARVILTHLKQ